MITNEHQMFINNALPALKADPRIVGVALGGSYARDAMDEYSDLNFILAVDPEHWDDVLADRRDIAAKLGNLLSCFTGEHARRPNTLICMYDEPLLHVDLNFAPLDTVKVRTEEPVILFERDGAMSKEYAKAPLFIPEADLQWYEDRFWIWVHYIANRIAREELFDAMDSLAYMRMTMLGPLMLIRHGKAPYGVRHIEEYAPDDIYMLLQTVAEHDRKSCMRALKAAADLYIYLRGVNKARLFLREEAEKRALQYLDNISQKYDL